MSLQLRRRLRSRGGKVLRRLGWLPEGMPDGLGQDDALRGGRIDQRVVVYYPGTSRNLYQLRQWYEALVALDRELGVVIVTADSRVGRLLEREAPLPVLTIARFETMDDLLSRSDVALFCYVGHEQGNFRMLRVHTALHVFLSHGESDKEVSASNQSKAYDYAFVAGQAALDRYRGHLLRFDADRHLVPVGRPQLDGVRSGPRPDPGRATVLYAPTWEGAQGSAAYSSVLSHGEALVRGLLAAGFAVIYRPHPRTGANRRDYHAADEALRRLVAAADDGEVDLGRDPLATFERADLLVTDVSAIALDWLATGRPLVVTVPAEGAVVATTRLLEAVPRLPAGAAARAGELVARELEHDPGRADRAELLEYYFGDPALGSGTERFVAACLAVAAERDALLAARRGSQ